VHDDAALTVARWQFATTWRLAQELHLPRLTDAMCLWQPAADSWTVRPDADGRWRADWFDPEPPASPPPSIAWLTWHIFWWWSDALSVLRGGQPLNRSEVTWSGSAAAAVADLRSLARAWDRQLGGLGYEELTRPVAFPWAEPRPVLHLISWVNLELMKNVAEVGTVADFYSSREH